MNSKLYLANIHWIQHHHSSVTKVHWF